jgi:spore germination protein YaaH
MVRPAHLIAAAFLVVAGCRRGSTSEANGVAPATGTLYDADTVLHGKRLHLWLTTCDPRAPEAVELLTRVATHPQVVTSVGFACQVLGDEGSFVTVGGTTAEAGRAELAARLHALGVRTSLVVANWNQSDSGGFDGALAMRVSEDPASRLRLVTSLVAARTLEEHGLVELDLEAMPVAAANGFTTLVAHARQSSEVAVDVHAKTRDDPGWPGPGAHDYAALARTGATLRVMTYDYSVGPVPPGPTTKAGWIHDVVHYARSCGVPAGQIEIGLPAYGYDFPPAGHGPPTPLTHRDAIARATAAGATIERDAARVPHFTYQAADGFHQVWFEDVESQAQLLADVADLAPDIAGFAVWGVYGAEPEMFELWRRTGL